MTGETILCLWGIWERQQIPREETSVLAEMVSGEQAGTGQHPATSERTTAGTTDLGTRPLLAFALKA